MCCNRQEFVLKSLGACNESWHAGTVIRIALRPSNKAPRLHLTREFTLIRDTRGRKVVINSYESCSEAAGTPLLGVRL